jgi:RND superfamily putative drug exporter
VTHVDEGPRPAIGPLGRLGRFAYRRRGTVALLWLATLLATLGLAQVFAGDFAADYSAPRSESKQAQQLLRERFASQSAAVVAVVVQSDAGVQSARGDVAALMDEWRRSGLDPETATIATLDTAGRSW